MLCVCYHLSWSPHLLLRLFLCTCAFFCSLAPPLYCPGLPWFCRCVGIWRGSTGAIIAPTNMSCLCLCIQVLLNCTHLGVCKVPVFMGTPIFVWTPINRKQCCTDDGAYVILECLWFPNIPILQCP